MMNNRKIGNVVKSFDFNKSFFIQEKTLDRNKQEIKIKFGNKNIFQKIANNIFIETNYRQGSMQHSFFSFSSLVSENTPAIFYFFVPDFLKNTQCKINISINPAVYFSKISNAQIEKTINTLTNFSQSNSQKNQITSSDYFAPQQATASSWQGAGYSDKVKPYQVITLLTSPYINGKVDDYDIGHYHNYKMVGENSTLISDNVYHKHNFKFAGHSHDNIVLDNHRHFFNGHQHSFSSFSHSHEMNLSHSHDLENNIYSNDKVGQLSRILIDNLNYSNNSKIDINSGKHQIKIYITDNISSIKCNIEIIGNYI